MIRSQIKVFERFPEITSRVEAAAREGLDAAAREAAAVAQANASIGLELDVVTAHGDLDGYSAGIRSRRTSSQTRGGNANATPIAWFFDRGTLGKRKRRLKRNRKEQWQVKRGGASYTAHRGDVSGKGIAPERFFGKARSAGRKALLDRIERL